MLFLSCFVGARLAARPKSFRSIDSRHGAAAPSPRFGPQSFQSSAAGTPRLHWEDGHERDRISVAAADAEPSAGTVADAHGYNTRGSWIGAMLVLIAAIVSVPAWAQTPLPAPVSILQDNGQTGDGYIFYTQQHGQGPNNGPVIMDTQGRPVWYLPLSSGTAADFRVQTYHGQPVLTWAQGLTFQNPTPNTGVDYIYDTSYNKIAEVRAGNGLNSDLHEFELTPDGTALITIYHTVPMDLSAVGGSVNGTVLEGVAQEVDVTTGAVLFEWHSLDHVGLDESYMAAPTVASAAYDYFHINSIKLDVDGNLLISARHTSTLYKVNRKTGEIIWRLGGKKSSFALAPDLSFGWQHNAVPVDASTIRIFDNSGAAPSHILWLTHDDATMTASLERSITHPAGIFAFAEGSAQTLSNGDTFVGWGTGAAISEFGPTDDLIYDVRFAPGYSTYRAYRQGWSGRPTTNPSVIVYQQPDGSTVVHAVWNGATGVANWQLVSTGADGSAQSATLAPWSGLDTAINVPITLSSAQVVALDASGAVLGTSAVMTGPFSGPPPEIDQQPGSATVATGSSLVLSVHAGDATAYQWQCNGQPLANGGVGGATVSGTSTPVLLVRGLTKANAGRYTCVVSNTTGAATSMPAIVAVADASDIGRLVNISCRSYVSGGEHALIAGFVIGGASPEAATEDVAIRASGPALRPFGVSDVLPDPKLDLYAAGGPSPIASAGAFPMRVGGAPVGHGESVVAPTGLDPRDAMLVQTLPSAAYTATITSPSGGAGVALAEVDDAASSAPYDPSMPRLINGSGRAQVGTGADILVAGFVIGGSTSRTVLIRASGPALARYGVTGALQDPQLNLYSSAGDLIASNNDWAGSAQVTTVANAVGAFPWCDAGSKDAAILVTLPPGAYTAQVSGADGGTGVALVEVYDAF